MEQNSSRNFTQLLEKLGHMNRLEKFFKFELFNIIVIIADMPNVKECITVR